MTIQESTKLNSLRTTMDAIGYHNVDYNNVDNHNVGFKSYYNVEYNNVENGPTMSRIFRNGNVRLISLFKFCSCLQLLISRGGGGGTLAGVTYHTPSTLPSATLASASVTYHYCLPKQFWYTLLYQNRSLWSTLKY